jgi:hypothetical protein
MEITAALQALLGHTGRMIAGSKSTYRRYYPKNLVVFNANIIIGNKKVWHGDLDISRDEPLLVRLAELTEQEVYVLYEMDGRFENEGQPKLDRAVYRVAKIPFLGWHTYVGEVLCQYHKRYKRTGIIQLKTNSELKKQKLAV